MKELNRLAAIEAVRQIAAGTITSEQLVRACLDRIAARDGEVRAWVHCDPDSVIAQARAVDRAGAKGVLAGVPCVTIPVGQGTAGLPLGVQFVGAFDEDERVLLCAEWARRTLA